MQNLIIHGFESIYWLITGAIVLMWLLFVLLRNKKNLNFIDEEILSEVYGKNTYWYNIFIALIFIISALFFLTLAGPYNNKTTEKISKNGIDIEIVFDLSHSMQADDLLPSRLTVAKDVFWDFINEIHSDRIGLILFAGKAFQSIPLSYDYDFVSSVIEDIDINTINQQNRNLQWTAIWDALVLAADVLSEKEEEREKIIILITDGTANTGVNPEIVLKLLQEKNIKTYTIWVGKQWETTMEIVVWPGFTQRIPIAWVDEEILKKISENTWWKYFRADSENTFKQILEAIADLEKSKLESEIISFHSSRTKTLWFLLLLSLSMLWYIVFVKKISL